MIISLASINSEMKSSNFQITFQPGQVNGEVDCCKTVRFDSTGPLAESVYAFQIGTYEYVADDAGGDGGVRGIYRCTDCSYELELYYNPPGNAFGVSIFHKSLEFYFLHTVLILSCTMRAGIWNTNTGCPEVSVSTLIAYISGIC